MNDQNKKTLRQFQCRDYLWEIFEQMSGELECSVDYLINEAMRQYARSRNYGARGPTGEPTGQRPVPGGGLPGGGLPAGGPPGGGPPSVPGGNAGFPAAPAARNEPAGFPTPGPGPRQRIPSQPAIPSAPPPPPSRGSHPGPQGYPGGQPYQGGQPSPAPQQQYGAPPQQGGYPAPPPGRSSPGGYPAPSSYGGGGGYGQQGGGQQGGYPAPPPYPSSGGYGQPQGGGYPAPPASRPQAPAPSSYPPPPQTTRPPAMTGGAAQGGYGAPAAPPPLPSSPGVSGSAGSHPAGMPTLFVIFNGQKFPVNKEEFIIGRGTKTADLAIKDGNISRRHAAIIFQNGGFYMKDLGSTNGVEYQGRRVDGRRIEEGDVYQLCDYELRFTYR